MGKLRERLQSHKPLAWGLLVGYTVFLGCFSFPLFSSSSTYYSRIFTFLVGYGMIAVLFAGLLERRRAWILLLAAELSTALGLLCRYLLEYGEASNEVNFVPFQIGIYLITVPLYMLSVFMAAYFAEQYFV